MELSVKVPLEHKEREARRGDPFNRACGCKDVFIQEEKLYPQFIFLFIPNVI